MEISARFKHAFLSAILAAAAAVAQPGTAAAVTIDFDDLDGVNPAKPLDGFQIANPYLGFDWTNFYVLHRTSTPDGGDGYINGIVSPDNIAYNGFQDPAVLTDSNNKLFRFNSGYFTAAFDDPDLGDIINVEIIGSRDGTVLYDMTIALNKLAPTFVDVLLELHLNAFIDTLQFNSINESQIVMDNLNLTQTPIPAALPLFGTALALGGFAFRRRKAKRAD
jgi:hypothetical protein